LCAPPGLFLYQEIDISGSKDDLFFVGGWEKADTNKGRGRQDFCRPRKVRNNERDQQGRGSGNPDIRAMGRLLIQGREKEAPEK